MSTGRNLYALYYESNNTKYFKVEKDGFIVKGKDNTGGNTTEGNTTGGENNNTVENTVNNV